jgi:hypothetical protein
MFLTFGGRRLFAPATFPPRVDLTTDWPHSLEPRCPGSSRSGPDPTPPQGCDGAWLTDTA